MATGNQDISAISINEPDKVDTIMQSPLQVETQESKHQQDPPARYLSSFVFNRQKTEPQASSKSYRWLLTVLLAAAAIIDPVGYTIIYRMLLSSSSIGVRVC